MSLEKTPKKTEDDLIKDFVEEDSSGVDPEDLSKEEVLLKQKKQTGSLIEKRPPSYEDYLKWLEKTKESSK